MTGRVEPPASRFAMPVFFLLFVVFAALPAAAQSGQSWQIRELSGDARVEVAGVQPVALTPGDQLTPGQRIVTGPSGRVVLERGEERIVVSPDSVVGLPKRNDGNFATRILHRVGTILLDVEHKDRQHFEVVTPFMTAVVKGTRFTVSVQGGAAAVHVVNGLVEVTDIQGRGRTFVRPGQTASANDAGLALNGQPVDPGAGRASGERAAVDETGTATVSLPEQASDKATVAITKTIGNDSIDVASLTKGLLNGPENAGPPAHANGNGGPPDNGNGQGPPAHAKTSGPPSHAGGGNGGGRPGHAGGPPTQAGGGNSGGPPSHAGGPPGQPGGGNGGGPPPQANNGGKGKGKS